jgi:hypothetical protein
MVSFLLFMIKTFCINYCEGRWKRLGMVAAGSGVAPMLLLLEHQLKKMQVDSAGRPDCEMHLLIVAHSEAGRTVQSTLKRFLNS